MSAALQLPGIWAAAARMAVCHVVRSQEEEEIEPEVGEAPAVEKKPVVEAVNFVLDIEKCISQLSWLDKHLLSRIVLQEYTVGEAAAMLGLNINTAATKLSLAVDKLTEILLKADLLVLPH